MHIGEIIKDYRTKNKLSMDAFSKKAKMSKAYVSVLEKNKRPNTDKPVIPSIPTIKNVATAMGMSFDELFNMLDDNQLISLDTKDNSNDEHDLLAVYNDLHHPRQLKVYHFAKEQLKEQQAEGDIQEEETTYSSIITGRQSAAGSAIYVDDTQATYDVLPASMIPNGANEVVEITGDSMEPLIQKGSKVYLRHQPEVENGEIAIVRIEDDGVTCKYFYHEGAQVRLKSANEVYDDIVVDASQVTVLGKVLM